MRGINSHSYKPYFPMTEERAAGARLPYICRLAPSRNSVEVEFFDHGSDAVNHTLYLFKRGGEAIGSYILTENTIIIKNLEPDCEYALYIARNDTGERGAQRLFLTGDYPGTVVNYLHPEDTLYDFSGNCLCSPSIERLPSGRIVASMDVFGRGTPQNLSLVFASDDGGKTWRYLTDLFPCFWGKLFWFRDALYMLCCSCEYGDLLISKSEDGGENFCAPVRLFNGSCHRTQEGMHKAPMPVIEHAGRLWTGVDYGTWAKGGHASGLISVSVDDDLMDPESWACTGFLKYDEAFEGAAKGPVRGTLEGNAVVAPSGEIVDFLRCATTPQCEPPYGIATIYRAFKDEPERAPQFMAGADFNGSNVKMLVRRDDKTGKYVALGNWHDAGDASRRVMALYTSDDLISWTPKKRLIDFSGFPADKYGTQYPDMIIDGENLLWLSRTACCGAQSHHDSNCTTFHVIENFRQYLQ